MALTRRPVAIREDLYFDRHEARRTLAPVRFKTHSTFRGNEAENSDVTDFELRLRMSERRWDKHLLNNRRHRLAYGHLKDFDVVAEGLELQIAKLCEVLS